MKRYLVFAGDTYYPGANCRDFNSAFDDLDEAKTHAKWLISKTELFYDWSCIFDVEQLCTIDEFWNE